ncbi:unnamed protein product [Paramecium octaurelia]|uniref:Uncharacterized protein n=1 Tax=Paramecium octaurelia TaxID=43137 RepID=A0A8S1YRI8_PAROT|nr:unnamed protein product [Paramecium octaurelia]
MHFHSEINISYLRCIVYLKEEEESQYQQIKVKQGSLSGEEELLWCFSTDKEISRRTCCQITHHRRQDSIRLKISIKSVIIRWDNNEIIQSLRKKSEVQTEIKDIENLEQLLMPLQIVLKDTERSIQQRTKAKVTAFGCRNYLKLFLNSNWRYIEEPYNYKESIMSQRGSNIYQDQKRSDKEFAILTTLRG